MTTKPLDFNKPITTRDGRPVRILCSDRKGFDFPVIALVTSKTGKELLHSYHSNGRLSYHRETAADLINPLPPKVKLELWVNVYNRREGYRIGDVTFYSEERARDIGICFDDYVATVPITVEFQPEE